MLFCAVMETMGAKYRTVAGIFYQGWFAAGYMLLALVAYFVRNHAHLQLCLGLTSAFFLSYWWLVFPEYSSVISCVYILGQGCVLQVSSWVGALADGGRKAREGVARNWTNCTNEWNKWKTKWKRTETCDWLHSTCISKLPRKTRYKISIKKHVLKWCYFGLRTEIRANRKWREYKQRPWPFLTFCVHQIWGKTRLICGSSGE